MKQKLYRVLTLALAAMLVVSLGMAARQQLQYRESAAAYDSAAQLAEFKPPQTLPEPSAPTSAAQEPEEEADPLTQALETINLAALQAENPDVAGWIFIPNTELSYPLLHGKNNDFYLYRSWNKTRNNCGSIFLDYRCAPDFEDYNTVIYGHRMRNDSMFGTLKYYKDEEFWREHPTVYIVDGSGVRLYDIFAAWEPSVTSVVYSMDFESEKTRQELIDACLAESRLDTGIIPTPEDKILTLSTCTGSGHATRWVVQAVERSGGADT